MRGEDKPAGPTDPSINCRLKERIIRMEEEVKDETANRICAQMLMLAVRGSANRKWGGTSIPRAAQSPRT
jgi:Protease subunit of ATP-dependent Clp proteases